ncbi:RodZ domain-containing protein [Aliikangiella maris]|uniref:RodZ domain-containing protein n=2 Tax=Aliikangiella maris TaxID=3162458 RepID=A0ABV2BV29_9GAMM
MDVVEDNISAEPSASLDIGALLVEARENKNLTAQDIAKQMHLTLSVINQLETNDFKQGIPLAFVRGYLRSYAQKVGVDVETICAEFDRQTGNTSEPIQSIKVISGFGRKPRKELNSNSGIVKLISFIIFFSLLALGGYEVWNRFLSPVADDVSSSNQIPLTQLQSNLSTTAETESTQLTETVQTNEDNRQAANLSEKIDLATDDMVGTASKTQTVNETDNKSNAVNIRDTNQPQNTPSNPSSELTSSSTDTLQQSSSEPTVIANSDDNLQANQTDVTNQPVKLPKIEGSLVAMRFEFFADCWVKITDANDEVLAVGVKTEGKIMPLQGVAPIKVILGEPSAVTLDFKGEAFDLSRFKAGRRATFVLQ